MESTDLLNAIEDLRRDLIETAATDGYSSKKIIKKSRELDDLLNQYEKVRMNHQDFEK